MKQGIRRVSIINSTITKRERERERESSSRLICHTERSEVSKNANANLQNPLDISVSTKPQYDKVNAGQYNKVDSIASECNPINPPSLAEGARGWVNPTSAFQTKSATAIKGSTSSLRASVASAAIHKKEMDCFVVASPLPRNDESFHTTPPQGRGAFKIAKSSSADKNKKPRKLALSFIASVALAGIALDILAAACSSTGQANYWTISCSGNMNASDLYNPPAISSGIVTVNLNNLTTNGGSKLFAFQRYAGSWATNGTRAVNFNKNTIVE